MGCTYSIVAYGDHALPVRVPFGAEPGRLTVRTPLGEGASAASVAMRATVSGLVTDTSGNPLPGVEVSWANFKTTTRNDGVYVLRDVAPLLGVLTFDPSKLPFTPPLPLYSHVLTPAAGRDNHLGTLALQPNVGPFAWLQSQSAQTQAVTLSAGGGLTFSLPANATVLFPPGAPDSGLFLTQVANSRVPAPFPAGVYSSTVAQLTPFGHVLLEGGKLTLTRLNTRCLLAAYGMLYVGTTGGLFRSADNGATWTSFNEGLGEPPVLALAVWGQRLLAGTLGQSVWLRELQ